MLKGNIVALVTPFNEDKSVNYIKLIELIEYQILSKVDGIVLLGTTGEASSLTIKEQLKIIKIGCKVIKNRVKLIIGCSAINTKETISKLKRFSKFPIDYFLVLTPFYLKTNTQGIINHFKAIANNTKIPLIIYHVPSRTGQKMDIECIEELSTYKNIKGIKDASGDIEFIKKIRKYINNDFVLLSGNDDLVIETIKNGGSGIISVLSNTHPDVMNNIVNHCFNQEYKEAQKLLDHYLDYIKLLFIEPNPIPIKEAMNYLEFDVGSYRLPLYNMSSYNKKILLNELEEISK